MLLSCRRKGALFFTFLSVVFSSEAARAGGETGEVSCYEHVPFWSRVTDKDTDAYCQLLDRGRARLYSSPREALALAKKAATLRSSATVATLLGAHAELLLDHADQAHAEFSRAVPDLGAQEIASLLSPTFVAAGARAALLSGDYEAALIRYRWVLLRLFDFHNPREEARLLIEAAVAASYASPDAGREARAYLAAAETKNAPLLRPIVQAAWALSLLRDGDVERAKRKVAHFESSWELVWIFEGQHPVGRPGETIPVLPKGEREALFAVVAEAVEPEAAEEHWQSFAEMAGAEAPQHMRRSPNR